jgi:hypothetical protein
MSTGLIGSYNSGSGIVDLLHSTTTTLTDDVLAFHYGNFDNHYGDGTVGAAAANGRVYADTVPATLPTKFGTIGTPSTASGQTTYTWTPPSTTMNANVLVVAGGGSGGNNKVGTYENGGGGGAGGVVYATDQTLNSASYTIVVGQGGIIPAGNGQTQGKNTTAFGYTALGGGGGSTRDSQTNINGGSGGGAVNWNPNTTNGQATQPGSVSGGFGNDGGTAAQVANTAGGSAGGGGATQVGFNGSGTVGADGGAGFLASAFGETYGESGWFAGGGAGGGGTGGTGGIGGGGSAGSSSSINGSSGANHMGGGGGGNFAPDGNAGNGGSGIVAIRYISDNNLILPNYVVTRNLAVVLDASSYSGTGTTWSDISGNGRNATIRGAVSWVNGGNTSYFDFPGANADYINQTAGTTQKYKDMCIVFQYEDSDWNYLLANSTTSDKAVRINGNSIANPGNEDDWAQSATTYYVNGVADTNAVALSQNQWYILGGENKNAGLLGSAWNYHIGTGYSGRSLNGKIAFLALYTEPLTAAEHIHNYNALKHRFGV